MLTVADCLLLFDFLPDNLLIQDCFFVGVALAGSKLRPGATQIVSLFRVGNENDIVVRDGAEIVAAGRFWCIVGAFAGLLNVQNRIPLQVSHSKSSLIVEVAMRFAALARFAMCITRRLPGQIVVKLFDWLRLEPLCIFRQGRTDAFHQFA